MAEFTGERVIPEKVDIDLWNEHRSRYLFAARLGRRKRILDVGCGTGYGSAELATAARSVVALDFSHDAVEHAVRNYNRHNVEFLQASADLLPFRDGAFDLVVAFELIEHLPNWPRFLEQVKRVLAPKGQFIVSTPNKLFYAESRRLDGPNPYHVHEFEFSEFCSALAVHFPYVSLFLQNHSAGVVFHPVSGDSTAEVRLDSREAHPHESNFFVAVCALTPQTGAPTFVYIPTAANVLRERAEHIRLLEHEIETKNNWLDQGRSEHQALLEQFRQLEIELEERNRWANELNLELEGARSDIDRLNTELAERAISYETKIKAIETENAIHARQLAEKVKELAHCVEALHATEKTVEERTAWAQGLDRRVEHLEAMLASVEASRWMKLGRAFRLGPLLRHE